MTRRSKKSQESRGARISIQKEYDLARMSDESQESRRNWLSVQKEYDVARRSEESQESRINRLSIQKEYAVTRRRDKAKLTSLEININQHTSNTSNTNKRVKVSVDCGEKNYEWISDDILCVVDI